jgi:hypothetical protein
LVLPLEFKFSPMRMGLGEERVVEGDLPILGEGEAVVK